MKMLTTSAVACLIASGVAAQDFELPKQLTWTAYGTGTSGYNQAVAFGKALQEAKDINLRILPAGNDLSRLEPLRQGKVPFSQNGIGTYMAQEGVFEFSNPDWGPQKLRLLATGFAPGSALALTVTKTACEKIGKPECKGFTHADFKGLRVAWVDGSPANNTNIAAYLALGDLTWDDVEKVKFGSYADTWKAMVEGTVDGSFGGTNSGYAYEAASSPNGLYWVPVDDKDAEAQQRMLSVAPYYVPSFADSSGAGLDGTEGTMLASYPFPILMSYDLLNADEVYNMTKAIFVLYDDYKDGAPGADGWAMEYQHLSWVVPYHEGAIKYFTEIGAWSEEAQANNDKLIARQEVLATAWEELKRENPSDWESAWAEKRKAALKAADMPAPF